MIEFLLGYLVPVGSMSPFAGYIDFALSVVGGFALLATQTKNKVDDRIAQFFCDIVNFFGANLKNAKNA